MAKIDLVQLQRRIDDGLVRTQTDGSDLTIYTYTPACQYGKKWDNYTRKCRGMILDKEGNVVCKTFDKFFNLNEMPETILEDLPKSGEILYEKLDGSLLQMFYHHPRWRVSTKGSFDNIYTEYAKRLLHNHRHIFPANWNIAFEIVLPIALDTMPRAVPHDPGLYFLAAFDKFSGKEIEFSRARQMWDGKAARRFENLSLRQAIDLIKTDKTTEGWVVHYPDSSNLRLKVKTQWFLKVFRVISRINESHIKELMLAFPIDATWQQDIPEELLPEAKRICMDIRFRMADANVEIQKVYDQFKHLPRKEYALAVKDHKYSHFLFQMLDGRDFQDKLLENI